MKGLKLHIWMMALCSLLMVGTGCRKLVGPTEVTVVDNGRHYVPIIQGEILRMFWTLRNEGPEPFVIEDVLPSCSAIKLVSDLPDVVIPHDSAVIIFDFDTDKNTNMATHIIRIYGNIQPEGVAELMFDVNIVRGTIDKIDYEERFFMRNEADGRQGDRKVRRSNYYMTPTYYNYSILFAANKTDIQAESMMQIHQIASMMKSNSGVSYEVQGHTDSNGTDAENNRLSQQRAEAVVESLVKAGISPSRLTAVGKGSRYPIADNRTEEGRAKNRRVVLVKLDD